ncbi:MAG: N-6 DNA methylase [Deltaproteobacteria bacterium]|nr:N-6 DNA methylase [Deltaproteobacteria bacterium]
MVGGENWHDIKVRESSVLSRAKGRNSAEVKKNGIFYTPATIARRMAVECLGPYLQSSGSVDEILQIKILDPACGSGAFLIEALLLIIERLKDLKCDLLQNRRAVLQRCIFGFDTDPQGIESCRELLVRTATLGIPGDTFSQFELPGLAAANSLFLDENGDTPRFTCILANPPYGTARDGKISDADKIRIAGLFPHQKLGKINKYMAFMLKSFELLLDNGSMSLLVPNSWLGIPDGLAVRKLLAESSALESVELYDCKLFANLGVETVILTVRKGRIFNNVHIKRFTNSDSATPYASSKLPYTVWRKTPAYQLRLQWDENIERLHEQLSAKCSRLGDVSSRFLPKIALQAYALGKGQPPQCADTVSRHKFHARKRSSRFHLKYLEGRDVKRYVYDWSGSYLKYGPWLAEPQTLDRFQGKRLLLREILNHSSHPINCCFISETALYNKSVLHILPGAGCREEDLLALQAVFNSGLAGLLIRLFGSKSQRSLFPKLLNGDLKSFPIPISFDKSAGHLGTLAADIMECVSSGNNHAATQKQREIDSTVYELYGLDCNAIPAQLFQLKESA